MKSILLTDAETKESVLVVFGNGGCVFAKPASDSNGTYTELYNSEEGQIVSVTESPAEIQAKLESQRA